MSLCNCWPQVKFVHIWLCKVAFAHGGAQTFLDVCTVKLKAFTSSPRKAMNRNLLMLVSGAVNYGAMGKNCQCEFVLRVATIMSPSMAPIYAHVGV